MEPLPKNETTITLNPAGVTEKSEVAMSQPRQCRSLANYKDMKK